MTFSEGEEILVTQKDGEWWTGSIGDRTGIFPSNYVKPKDQEVEFLWYRNRISPVAQAHVYKGRLHVVLVGLLWLQEDHLR